MNCDMEKFSVFALMSYLVRSEMMSSKRWLQEMDLKPHQAGILFVLDRDGSMSQKELARVLRQTPPSVTNAIQKMEQKGYILRQPDEKDQRVLRLHLTEKSQRYLSQVKQTFRQMEAELFEGISKEEKEELRKILLRMLHNIEGNKESDRKERQNETII
nr:MarR family transcriptional regulator [uncultured Mediterraneibacter sp.]